MKSQWNQDHSAMAAVQEEKDGVFSCVKLITSGVECPLLIYLCYVETW